MLLRASNHISQSSKVLRGYLLGILILHVRHPDRGHLGRNRGSRLGTNRSMHVGSTVVGTYQEVPYAARHRTCMHEYSVSALHFIHTSLTHSIIHSLTHSLTHSLARSFVRSFVSRGGILRRVPITLCPFPPGFFTIQSCDDLMR